MTTRPLLREPTSIAAPPPSSHDPTAPPPAPSERLAPIARRSRKRLWLSWAAVALVAAATFGAWRATHRALPVHYVTAPVTRGSVTRTITASGAVNPETTVQVGSYVSGVIVELTCDYNTRVHKGQRCAKIDPRPYQSALDQDRANLAAANAQLAKDQTTAAYAKASYDRAASLFDRSLVSQDDLDSAKSTCDAQTAQVDVDRAAIAQHQAAVSSAEINLDYTDIVSPVDGTVVLRNVTMGQTVAASFQTPTLFLIATDLTKMQVDTNVSESDIGGLRIGDRALFTVEAFPDRTFQGAVTQVRQAPQTVQNVVTYDVVLSAANADLLLKPGMTATALIVIERRDDVLRVPDQALRYTPGGVLGAAEGAGRDRDRAAGRLWVLRGGAPVAVTVTAGLDDDTYTEIVAGGLEAGDAVIVSEQSGTSTTAAERPPTLRF